jgi:hypothetical protein
MDEPMPKHVAELAPLLSIEAQMFRGTDEDGEGVLPDGDDGYFAILVPDAVLYAARMPTGDREWFLMIANDDGVFGLIFGNELAVTRDGIVG